MLKKTCYKLFKVGFSFFSSNISLTVPLSVATKVIIPPFPSLLLNCNSPRLILYVYILEHIAVRLTVADQETVKAVGHLRSLSPE